MTIKPLTDAFPWRSALAVRTPDLFGPSADDESGELLVELRDELAHRRIAYPRLVSREAMNQAEADRHIAIWAAVVDWWAVQRHEASLYRARCSGAEPAPTPTLVGRPAPWDAMVRELRRELAMRRNKYPKWIESPTNPLTAADAARKLECLDAIHWRMWNLMMGFDGSEAQRMALIADREGLRLAGRDQDEGGDPAMPWRAIARAARAIHAGETPRDFANLAMIDHLRAATRARAEEAAEAALQTAQGTEARCQVEPDLLVIQLDRWMARQSVPINTSIAA